MSKPNIILIMSDQHNKRAMSGAGHPYVKTPALDRLASRGVSFRQAFCAYPLCGPSRSAFMTSQHPYENGVVTNQGEFRTDTPTFAHQFLASGYETVISGRMHFVGIDQRHGFEKRLISELSPTAFHATPGRLDKLLGMGDLHGTAGMSKQGIDNSGPGRTGYLSYDEHVTQATVKFLEERKTNPSDKPYMMTVGYIMPHCPFVAESDDFYQYWNQLPTPQTSEEGLGEQHPFHEELRRQCGVNPLPDVQTQKRVASAYYGMVNHLDRQIDTLMQALEASGEADNTIIVYTSDHGEQLGAHGLWWKSTFYEGSIGVPLIISRPNDPRAGEETVVNVSLIDIGPTLLDLAGLDPLPGVSGQSFSCVLDGKESDWRDEAFAELSNPLGGPKASAPGLPQRMFKQGDWKYVYYHGMRPQLFNTADDPNEEHDLWNDPAQADRLKAMQDRALENWNPEKERQRHQIVNQRWAVIAKATCIAPPPEPEPVWFDGPLENHIDPIQ
ncbi:MAG: sulfatase-like hydrolase/transferase [Phycisphaeraceae bacterium]|nr:sulfatase-like hydrolase/transferase [Phycisphaeraceae bacterium]